jgi:hypothetical protein
MKNDTVGVFPTIKVSKKINEEVYKKLKAIYNKIPIIKLLMHLAPASTHSFASYLAPIAPIVSGLDFAFSANN